MRHLPWHALFWTVTALCTSTLSIAQVHPKKISGAPSVYMLGTGAEENLAFDVASIKPTNPHAVGWKMEFSINGFTARGANLRMLVQEAFNAYETGRLLGGPTWLDSDKYDIDAKLDPSEVPTFSQLSLAQRRKMLQKLLEDRFKLGSHHEQRGVAVFALRVAKKGLKMSRTKAADDFHGQIKGFNSLVTQSGPGLLEGRNFTMTELAHLLEPYARHIVLDRTGIEGRYDFLLRWTPDEGLGIAGITSENVGTSQDAVFPSFFTALQEQVGLRLEPTQAPVEVLVIDHAEKPSEN